MGLSPFANASAEGARSLADGSLCSLLSAALSTCVARGFFVRAGRFLGCLVIPPVDDRFPAMGLLPAIQELRVAFGLPVRILALVAAIRAEVLLAMSWVHEAVVVCCKMCDGLRLYCVDPATYAEVW